MIYNGGGTDETWADTDFEDEEEEEALSLCDLPTFDYDSENPSRKESPKAIEYQDEFNFCDQSLNETELCAADDVFFQGQIVPMDNFAIKQKYNKKEGISSIVEEPMDHSSSGGFTSESSRSSSISSLHSSSSSLNSTSTAAAAAAAKIEKKLPKTRVLNQFQFSQPSPKSHVRIPSTTTKNRYFSNNPKSNSISASWTMFRVGLVTTPEIGIQDLKVRNNCKRSNGTDSHNNNSKNEKKKKEQSFFNKKGVLFSSCKCSAVNSASIVMKEEHHQAKEEKDKQQRAGKQSLSRHRRTFEWLKQLSLETATDEF